MAEIETISVAITPEMAAALREAVESEDYVTDGEAVREALRDWMEKRDDRRRAIERLRRLIDEGIESGPSIDGEAAMAEILAELEEQIGRRAAE